MFGTDWLTWQRGRQESGYQKMLLAGLPGVLPFDVWLLKYEQGAHIDWHCDPVEGMRHYRLNIELHSPLEGGEFQTESPPLLSAGPVVLFRPDENRHRVTEITRGVRYVLSAGMALPSIR